MARRNNHTLLWVAGAGVTAYVGYQWVYKPWAAARAANDGLPSPAGPALLPYYPPGSPNGALPPTSMISAPGAIVGFNSLGPQYGGVLGACIAKKGGTWSPEKCQGRLNDLVAAATAAKAQIAALKASTPNPAAVGVPAARLKLAEVNAAIANDDVQLAAAQARGDTNAAAIWQATAVAHRQEAADITTRIAAAQAPVNNSSAIAAWEGALAGHDTDYFNLTGTRLVGVI